jgi:NAD(P)H-hydrate repair Nnr-like enzyme with NAD(P)H-hydrate dehydratase domain
LIIVQRHAVGARVWAVEGAGHYGVGLARYLSERCESVLWGDPAMTPDAPTRCGGTATVKGHS